jgi:regulation of enolase protein 1 (concanavalin A-like superfamily)
MSKWEFSNPPSNITSTPTSISFTTHPNTDFWHPPTRLAANGHFYYTKAVLPYSYGIHLQCSFQGEWKVTYDQGGVMIREAGSQTKWIKAGVEFVDGKAYLRYQTSTFFH